MLAMVILSDCFFSILYFKHFLNLLQYCFCFTFWFFGHQACEILVPWPGIEPALHVLEGEVLTTGLPAKSLRHTLNIIFP